MYDPSVVPNAADRATIHRVIFDELCKGEIHDESRAVYEEIAARYIGSEGADSVILGCTEVGMLLNQVKMYCSQSKIDSKRCISC